MPLPLPKVCKLHFMDSRGHTIKATVRARPSKKCLHRQNWSLLFSVVLKKKTIVGVSTTRLKRLPVQRTSGHSSSVHFTPTEHSSVSTVVSFKAAQVIKCVCSDVLHWALFCMDTKQSKGDVQGWWSCHNNFNNPPWTVTISYFVSVD